MEANAWKMKRYKNGYLIKKQFKRKNKTGNNWFLITVKNSMEKNRTAQIYIIFSSLDSRHTQRMEQAACKRARIQLANISHTKSNNKN